MEASNLSLVQYWDSSPPPGYIADLLATFQEGNPKMEQVVFDEGAAEAFIGRHLGPREVAAFRACAVPAMQADYFRYCAILVLGGVYCDVGYRCIAPMETLVDGCAGGRLFHRSNGTIVNGIFGFRAPCHPLLELALEVATANIENRVSDQVWEATGPAIFTALSRFREAASLEAFVAQSSTIQRGNLQPVAATLSSLPVEHDRVVSAFEDIDIAPLREIGRWIANPGFPLPYRRSRTHWLRFGSPIFR